MNELKQLLCGGLESVDPRPGLVLVFWVRVCRKPLLDLKCGMMGQKSLALASNGQPHVSQLSTELQD